MENIIKKVKIDVFWDKFINTDQEKIKKILTRTLLGFLFFFTVFTVYTAYDMETITIKIIQVKYAKTEMQKRIETMVAGFPVERMSRYIAKRDKKTAAFIVAIAKKESNWGKRKPVLDGEDCYNYWGYRGKREKMGSGGHTCFDSPRDAVNTVANRIDELVLEQDLDTPSEMVVWKCGRSCDNHDPNSVKKWIADIDLYYKELLKDQ